MGKPLNFKALGAATDKANAVEETKAPKKAKAAPPVEDTDEEETEDTDEEETEAEEAPPPPLPKAKRKALPAPLPTPVDEDGEELEETPAPKAKSVSPRAAAKAAFDAAVTGAPDHILQFFGNSAAKGEAKILATAFAELAEHLSANLPRNPERAQCLRKLLEANDCAQRAATSEG